MLYKFFKINEHSLKVLKENELFFSNPINFNDPFDCNPQFKFLKNTDEDCAAFFFKTGKVILSNKLDFEYAKKSIKSAFEDFKLVFQKDLKNIGILCLSEKLDNLLMWSHYASGHSGFCLGLDFNTDFSNSELSKLKKIKFTYPVDNKYPIFDPLKFLEENNGEYIDELIDVIFSTKSKDWGYEKEWRLFVEKGDAAYRFPKNSFKAIYFGLKTSDEDIKKIMKIRSDLNYYKAFYSDDTIGLKFQSIDNA